MGLSVRAASAGALPRGVIIAIGCDGRLVIGSLGLACSPPIEVLTDGWRGWAPEAAKRLAREAGWRNRQDDRFGDVWLCPGCAR